VKRSLLGLAILAILALTHGLGSTETSAPFLFSPFEPSPETILARSTIGTLNAQEFCVYFLLNRENPPDLYMRYRMEQNPEEKAALQKQIRSAIENYFVMRALAQQAVPRQSLSPAEKQQLRIQKYPIYEWVWVDRYLKSTFTVRPEDIKKYYKEHLQEFTRPEELLLRYLLIPIPEEKAGLGPQDARRQLERVRDSVVLGRDFALAARNVLPDIQVSTCTLQQGERRPGFPEMFYIEAFKLQPGELSSIIETAHGVYLIECVERREETPVPLEQVADQIRDRLRTQILTYQYHYMLNKLRESRHPEDRVRWLGQLDKESRVIRVGGFALTKGDLLADNPELTDNPSAAEFAKAAALCTSLINMELIAQACEQLNLNSDPRLDFADRVCRDMPASERARQTYVQSRITITAEQERAYYQQDRDLFRVKPSYTVFRITGTLTDKRLAQVKIAEEKKQLRSMLQQCMKAIENRWRAGQSARIASGQPAQSEHGIYTTLTQNAVSELLKNYSTKAIVFDCDELRYTPARENSALDAWVRNVDPGKFSPIGETENTLFVYFVAGYQPARELDFDSVRPAIQALLRRNTEAQVGETLRKNILEDLDIHFTFY
jgi:hypothetical protein